MIKFGTDGWRGIIGEDYNVENVCLVTQAIADYINSQGHNKPLAIGYDARFMSRRFAQWVAGVLVANGIRVLFSTTMCPSPAISWAAKLLNTAGGIMITASHNPAEYNGIKFKTPQGGSASPEIMAEIEKCLRRIEELGQKPRVMNFDDALLQRDITYFDPAALHRHQILRVIDINAISKVPGKVIFDAMHGSAMGYMQSLVGPIAQVQEIRSVPNPNFGGVNPEPIALNLGLLMDAVKKEQAVLGLATDGDGDRIGAVDADGSFINSHQIFAILTKYLIEKRGWHGEVVRSCTVSNLVDRVAQKYGLKSHTTPVGFKHICDLMLTRDVMIGGEESGGIGIKNYIPERDGVLLGLLLMEAVSAYGKSLGEILRDIMAEVGYYYFERIDAHISHEKKTKLMEFLYNANVRQIAGAEILDVITIDGVKFVMHDGWIMFRPSGTEPIVRIYAEATTMERLFALKNFGQKVIS